MDMPSVSLAGDAGLEVIERRLSKVTGGSGSLLIVASIAVVGLIVACAALCVILHWMHARQPVRAFADRGGALDNCAVAKGKDLETAGHPLQEQWFEVWRLSNTTFACKDLQVPAGASCPPKMPTLGSVPEAVAAVSMENCEICCERSAEIVLLPCSHGGICRQCSEEILRRSAGHCPHCRGAVERMVLVDSPVRLLQGEVCLGTRIPMQVTAPPVPHPVAS
mmetsp:Transcript_40200/g.92407  ORF Transcript_40200/g.92407 Transcript_40200/m.92407 type:complete len:222 (-) Transcript_40200:25-690(-)